MATTERLDSPPFHEHEWGSFAELRDWFEWEELREVEFVDELPRTSTGKVRRQSLREREGIADD